MSENHNRRSTFGLAAYLLSRCMFFGRTAIIVTISLPTAIPTAVAGFALLLLWGKYGMIGKYLSEDYQIMFTPRAIILASIFVTGSLLTFARHRRVRLDHPRLRQPRREHADRAALHLRQVQRGAGRGRQRQGTRVLDTGTKD